MSQKDIPTPVKTEHRLKKLARGLGLLFVLFVILQGTKVQSEKQRQMFLKDLIKTIEKDCPKLCKDFEKGTGKRWEWNGTVRVSAKGLDCKCTFPRVRK